MQNKVISRIKTIVKNYLCMSVFAPLYTFHKTLKANFSESYENEGKLIKGICTFYLHSVTK